MAALDISKAEEFSCLYLFNYASKCRWRLANNNYYHVFKFNDRTGFKCFPAVKFFVLVSLMSGRPINKNNFDRKNPELNYLNINK